MALLEDQIEEAHAALIAAHDAKDVEGAQVLADHVRELQAQKDTVDKAALESSKEGTNLTNPLIAGGVGAIAGAAVNPVLNAIQDIAAPPKISTPHPSQISTPAAPWTPPKFTPHGQPVDPNVPKDVYNWMSGQHAGVPVRGQNQLEADKLAQEFHAKNAARADFEAKNPGRSILDNGIEVSKADYDYVEGMKKKNQDAALLEHRIEQNAAKSAAAKQAESAGRFNILPGPHQPSTPFSIVKGGAKGAITGAAAADIPQQLSQGNFGTAAADTGIAGGNIINSLGRTPRTKAIGKLIGIGSGVLRSVQGVNELTGAPEEQKATGGLVHLANGGQPEDAPYVGYPQVNRNRQEGYGTGYLNTLATAIDPTGLTAAIPEANASMLSETPKERSYREGKEAAQPIAEVIGNLQMLNFGKQLVKPALKYAIPKAMKTVEQLKHLNTPHGYAGGGDVAKKAIHLLSDAFAPVKKSGVQLAREANYAHDLVPTHNFSEPQKLSIQDLQGGVLVGVPGDRSLTGHSLMSVNGVPLSKSVELHGGPRYGQRKSDLGEDSFWASQNNAASALQNKATNAAERAKGNPVFGMYTAMAPDASNYALHHTEALVNQLDALSPNKAKLRAFDSMIKEQHPDFLGMQHPEVMDQFAANSDLRKYVADRLNKSKIAAEYGMPSGEATIHAITDPALRNVSTGSTGFSVGEMRPGASLRPELEHPTYDTQIPGQFKGQMIAQLPWQHYFPEAAAKIAANPNQAPHAWGTFKMGDYHQPVTQELVDKISPIEEMVKSATKDFKGHAAGGKVGALGKLFEEAQAAYKAKFTPGFYHGSPDPSITSFDPLKSTKRDVDLVTPGVTFATKHPKFADSFTNGMGPYISLKTGEAMPAQAYTKGATMYPVSIDLSNHFDPMTPEGFQVVRDYVAKKYADNPDMASKFKSRIQDPHSNWTSMESPSFLQHLKDTGHTSFAVNESGYPNVGVFDPSKIRGKFAEYNPADAASPEFMKAAGGLVHLAGGGLPEKVVGNWLIGGNMKVNRVLTDEEVQAINEAAGAADLPRFTPLK